ncbi:MAG: BlaI/MecI/CopY family transcriptional regulator [Bacteroidales bacterium]|nr:BlaI/MecI/CopY family transcriptional regulator [Bacteroidales bacterium]
MKNLSKSEEELMAYLWNKEKCFLKDLILAYPQPHPAKTTIATLLKRIQEKGLIGYRVFGNSRQYYPLISKEDYLGLRFKEIIRLHFNNSVPAFTAFLTQTLMLERTDLEKLKQSIDKEVILKRNKDAVFY